MPWEIVDESELVQPVGWASGQWVPVDESELVSSDKKQSEKFNKKTFGQKILKARKDLGESVLGFGESLISVPSGLIAFAPSVIGAIGSLPFTRSFQKAREIQQKISQFLTHEPQTKYGKLYTNILLSPLEVFGKAEDLLAQKLAPNNPEAQAAIRLGFEAALLAAPALKGYLKSAIKTGKGISTGVIKKVTKESKALPPEVQKIIDELPDTTIEISEIEFEAAPPKPVVAIKDKATGKVYLGNPGETTHAEIAGRLQQIGVKPDDMIPGWKTAEGKWTESMTEAARSIRPSAGKMAAGQIAYGQKLPETTAGPRVHPITGLPIKHTLRDVAIGLDKIINPELTLEKAGEYAYSIKKNILELVDAYKETRAERKLNEPRRWKSEEFEATKQDMAKSIGIEDMAKKLKVKSEDLDALTDLVHDAMIKVGEQIKLAEERYRANPTEANALLLTTAKAKGLSVISAWKEAGTEQARALSIRRKIAQVEDYIKLNDYIKARKLLGDEINPAAQWALDQLDFSNPMAVAEFVKDWKPIMGWDAAHQIYINLILTNPTSHLANIVGSTLAMAGIPIEVTGAAAIELIRAPLTKTPRQRFFGELPAGTLGAIRSFIDPAKLAGVGFEHGIIDGVRAAIKAFLNYTPRGPEKAIEYMGGSIFRGKVGRKLRPYTPTNFLSMADQAFKAIIYNATKYQHAYRTAAIEGNRGAKLITKTAEYINHPTEAIKAAARKEALYRTFNEEVGAIGKSIMALRREIKPLIFFAPFIKSPGNIFKYAYERSLWGLLKFTKIGEKSMGRKAISIKTPEASDLIARVTMGTATAAVLLAYATKGNITGSGIFIPKSERDKLRALGWQPYSFKIGDKYFSYLRFDPLSHLIGLVADWNEMNVYREKLLEDEKQTGIAFNISLSVGKNLINKVYMQRLFDIISAIEDPSRGERILANLLTSPMPAISGAVARAIDPTLRYVKPETRDPFLREAEATLRIAMSKIPGLSKSLPPQYDIRGEPIKREGGPAWQLFVPATMSSEKNDPVIREFLNLGLSYGFPGKQIGPTKVSRDINQEQTALTWNLVNRQISPILRNAGYQNLPKEQKIAILKKIVAKAREAAREMIIKKYGIKTR